MLTRIIQIVLGITGLAALTLGLIYWIANINLISIHMLFGLLVAVTLLVMSGITASTRALRIWGIIGIFYALLVPVFGITQSNILPGSIHWLIQTAHMLVGIGAMVLTGIMSSRYRALKQLNAQASSNPQFVRQAGKL